MHSKYTLKDGTLVPRCTSIIDVLGFNKKALIAWARKTALSGVDPFAHKKSAADTGTLTHLLVGAHIHKQSLPSSDLQKYSFDNIALANNGLGMYKEWETLYNPTYHEIEYKIISEQYKWGGTSDVIMSFPTALTTDQYTIEANEYVLGDFKTSKSVYQDAIIQIAAYEHGLNEEGKYPIKKRLVFHIPKDADNIGVHPIWISDQLVNEGWELFLLARRLYDLKDTAHL